MNDQEAMVTCLRVLKESKYSRFDSVLIISHITFRHCGVQICFQQPFSKYLNIKPLK